MAKNWAIVVGVKEYSSLNDLDYAVNDAKAMRDWFENEAKFDRVLLFTDNSPQISTKKSPIPTQPTFGHLRRFLRAQFEEPLLKEGDNLWFFFAGHGKNCNDCDYLMLSDSDPGDVENTSISVEFIIKRLRHSGADNVILFLDACRDKKSRGSIGIGGDHQGVITFYSCQITENAYEVEELQQGVFTHTLLQGLRIQGENNCATVERLDQYLRSEVPKINRRYHKPIQNPHVFVDPASKLHLILLPKQATLDDLTRLKNDAYQAEVEKNWELARQLWIRINIASAGTDMDVIKAFSRMSQPQDYVELRSEVGIDYKKLQILLMQQMWEEADRETIRLMFQVVLRKINNNFQELPLKQFPYIDFCTIDNLWVKYSNGRFGFSIQSKILFQYVLCKGINLIKIIQDNDEEEIEKVIHEVCELFEWSINLERNSSWEQFVISWLDDSEIQWGINTKEGHLPSAMKTWFPVLIFKLEISEFLSLLVSSFLKKSPKNIEYRRKYFVDIEKLLPGIKEIFIKFKEDESIGGYVSIFGLRASGKQVFIAALNYFSNVVKNSPVESIRGINEDTEILTQKIQNIILQQLQLSPSGYGINGLYNMPNFVWQILIKANQDIFYEQNYQLSIVLKMFCGEVFEHIFSEQSHNRQLAQDITVDITGGKSIIFIIDSCDWNKDEDIAKSIHQLQKHLSKNELTKFTRRIAVVFSKIDLLTLTSSFKQYMDDLEQFTHNKFPKTRKSLNNWILDTDDEVAYFSCSAYGFLNESGKQASNSITTFHENIKWENFDLGGVVKYPERWTPFGVVPPIYWLLTGKQDSRLFEITQEIGNTYFTKSFI